MALARRPIVDTPSAAEAQAGVFTAAQAIDHGVSGRQIRRRIETGYWRRLAGRGLVARDQPCSRPVLALAWAAHLTWPEAVVGYRVAAVLHGFPLPRSDHDGQVHVVSRPGRRRLAGVVPHAVPCGPREVVYLTGRLPLTSRQRTAVDCLSTLPFDQALDLYAWLSTRRELSRSELSAAVIGGTGRHGIRQLRALQQFTAGGAVSEAERRLHHVLVLSGLSGWRAAAQIHDREGLIGVVEVVFTVERVVIEVDGRRAHSDPETFVRDRRRQNRLMNAGYLVLRFTRSDVVGHPERLVADISQALSDRRPIAM
jgi:very-short-patch-repair endonuclease